MKLTFFIFLYLTVQPLMAQTCDPKKDSLVLVTLYESTNSQQWTNTTNWKVKGKSIDQWFGINEVNREGCVTILNLQNNNLNGRIPLSIGSLSELKRLNLSQNTVSGRFLDTLTNLTKLEFLSLYDTKGLVDSIPKRINKLKQLQTIFLIIGNGLTGSIPTTITELDNLVILGLGSNNLTGTIPSQIGLLKKLEQLSLNENPITGTIPKGLYSIKTLKFINFNRTRLQDNIDAAIGNLENLEYFDLQHNKTCYGTLPKTIGQLKKLNVFNISHNQFSGTIPAELGNCLSLEQFAISNNQFDNLPNMAHINFSKTAIRIGFYIDNNRFTFEDILPQMPIFNKTTMVYAPQDSFFRDTTITIRIGDPLSIDLKIDASTPSNRYVWWKDNARFKTVGDTIFSNKLVIPQVQARDTGVYKVHVTNPNAPDLTLYSRSITVKIVAQKPSDTPPDMITPNGDTINDTFDIPELVNGLDPVKYPDNELVVINRWGSVVYAEKNYQNQWQGTNQNGEDLPAGTYYYIMRLNISEGKIKTGDLLIVR